MAVALALLPRRICWRAAAAWQNVLRAAYPKQAVRFVRIAASYIAGAGLNSFIPARVGDAVKIFLAKKLDPGLLISGDHLLLPGPVPVRHQAGVLVLRLRDHPGPAARAARAARTCPPSTSPSGPQHPRLLILSVTMIGIGLVIAVRAPSPAAPRSFWDRVKQGVVVLSDPPRFLREVVSWQGVAWAAAVRLLLCFLEAFQIGGSFSKVMLVMSVQSIANAAPASRRAAPGASRPSWWPP